MMIVETTLAHPLVQNLGWALLHSVWQCALVALLLANGLAALRGASAASRYAASAAALLLMLAAPALTFAYLNAGSDARADAARAQLAAAAVLGPERFDRKDGAEEFGGRVREGMGAEAAAAAPASRLHERASRQLTPFLHWPVGLWLAGVLLHMLRLFGGWRVAQRLRRQGARPLGAGWEESLARLRRQLQVGRAVRLCESVLVEVPTLVGWVKPVILVPAGALAGLTAPQLEALIAHELAHVRRHDYLVNLVQSVAETLLFYHPGVRWASRQLRIEREHACDDLAVKATRGGRVAYARALASLEQLRGGLAPTRVALGADGGGPLIARIRRLVGGEPAPRAPRRTPSLAAAGLLLSAALGVYAGAQGVGQTGAGAPEGGDAGATARGRTVAVTFVSAPTFRPGVVSIEETRRLTKKLLSDMSEHEIQSVAFVGEGQLGGSEGGVREARLGLLRAWLDAGHELGSQSYRHLSLFDTSLAEWQENVVRGEPVLRRLLTERGRKLRYFSYPYLNTGRDASTKQAAAEFLKGRGYTVHPVTIDSTEWLFAGTHQDALRRGDAETARRVADEYVPYMERMMEFYEGLSRDVFGREIPQVLMLTASPVVADQFDELVGMLKRRGYRFVTLAEAIGDEAYAQPETYAGEWGVSWLQRWAYTKFGALRPEPGLPPYMYQFGRDGALSLGGNPKKD